MAGKGQTYLDERKIYGASPHFGERIALILADIEKALRNGELTQGENLEQFENQMAGCVGTKFAIAVNSGGVALELTLKALDVMGKEVIVPTDTFVSSAAAVFLAGGQPVFADVTKEALCLDPSDATKRINSRTAGIMLVHMFGLITPDLVRIQELCKRNGLFLLEDASHAHGASRAGVMAGNIGDAACFSFHATKIATTGEGGVVTTNRRDIYEKILQLRNHGRSLTAPVYETLGNNYRLTELQAILGRYQIEDLAANVKRRNEIAAHYRSELSDEASLSLLPEFNDSVHAYWRFPLYLNGQIDRQALQQVMWDNHGIRITWMYEPLCHLQPVFRKSHNHGKGDFSVAEQCLDRLICLPVYPGLPEEDVQRVCQNLKIELRRLRQSTSD